MSITIFDEPFSSQFTKKQEIARGLRGVIRCVVDNETGKCYAAKTIRKTQKGQSVMDEINAEIKALEICTPSDTVINIHSVFKTSRDYTLILDYIPRDLHTEIEKDTHLREQEVVKIIYALVKTLKFLHERNIVHLGNNFKILHRRKNFYIKPENILMDDKNGIHLCDFGMAKFLDDSKTEICRIAGTTEYCAPEQIQFDPLSPASDMWSVGCCAFVLLSKISPFKREKLHETQNAVIDGDFDFDGQIWNTRSNEAKNFISKLLQKSPKDRGTAVEMLEHPWLKKRLSKRLSKRTSSAALGIGEINMNVSDCSSSETRSLISPDLAETGNDLENMCSPANPPKKPRHLSE